MLVFRNSDSLHFCYFEHLPIGLKMRWAILFWNVFCQLWELGQHHSLRSCLCFIFVLGNRNLKF